MSYIKRKDAKNAIFDYICEQTVSKYPSVAECKAARTGAEGAFNEIDYVPAADVVEVRHGRWIKQKPDDEVMKKFHDMGLGKGMGVNSIYWTCSVCENWGTPNHKYCSSCGAKMDGERKDNGT